MLKELEYQPWLRKKIIIFLGLLVLLLTVFEIWAVNRLSTYGQQISKIEESKASLKLENEVLENEVAKRNSLTEVKSQAQTVGFEKVKAIDVIDQSNLAYNK